MKRLFLLRHAKSSPGEAGQQDHERPLSGRGRRAADRMGELLAQRGDALELALCSSATRTQQTLERVLEQLEVAPGVEVERDLYLASCEELLARVRVLPDSLERVLLVGHNPGIAELAERLASSGPPQLLASLREKFPTGALAILCLAAPRWADAPRGAELEVYALPRELDDV